MKRGRLSLVPISRAVSCCAVSAYLPSSGGQRHDSGKKILDATAAAAPAFGMIGTLIGLVQMLRTLDDPSQIGVGMATALLAHRTIGSADDDLDGDSPGQNWNRREQEPATTQ